MSPHMLFINMAIILLLILIAGYYNLCGVYVRFWPFGEQVDLVTHYCLKGLKLSILMCCFENKL